MAEQRRGHVVDQRGTDLERFGVKPDIAAAWLAQQDCLDEDEEAGDTTPPELSAGGPPLYVWPENHQVLELFLRLETQWRKNIDGRIQGLRYDAVDVVMRVGGFKKRRRLFGHLQEMENAVLNALQGGLT